MTAQFNDTLHFRGNTYELAGISGGGLFEPSEHGLEPFGNCTACWAGYLCTYAVRDNTLLLDQLEINLKPPLPTLFGIAPDTSKGKRGLFEAVYRNMGHKLPFSGGLLIARGFIQNLYVHMGYHPAWKYRTVYELIAHEGDVVEAVDKSAAMGELRNRLAGTDEFNHPNNRLQVEHWIKQCFSRRYDE